MQLYQLKPIHPRISQKRVGRGGKRGTFSGKGTKGQHARAGHRIRPAERDFIQRLPKLRGVGNIATNVNRAKALVKRRKEHRALGKAKKLSANGKNS
jgi:ribosomal protein L15